MKRRVVLILFFVVVFGLPVAWYLFLQVFGENQFALPEIEQWDQQCMAITEPTLVVKEGSFDPFPNQWERVESKIRNQDLITINKEVTCSLKFDVQLVDESGWVRSQMDISREEIDRLLAEIDILILNHHE